MLNSSGLKGGGQVEIIGHAFDPGLYEPFS